MVLGRSLWLDRCSVVTIDIDGSHTFETTAAGWRARLGGTGGKVAVQLAVGGLLAATVETGALVVATRRGVHVSGVTGLAQVPLGGTGISDGGEGGVDLGGGLPLDRG